MFSPADFQQEVLKQRGQDTLVQGPKQPGFGSFFMPSNMELAKAVFAEEGSGTITQGLSEQGGFRAFGEQALPQTAAAAVSTAVE